MPEQPFHHTGFDPHEQLIKVSNALETLIQAHNNLALEHEGLKKVCQRMLTDIQCLKTERLPR
jgi:hypothetical protein